MFKLFSVEGATKMIPVVDASLQDLQATIADLKQTQADLADLRPDSAEALNDRQELAFLVRSVHDARTAVQRLGVQVPDLGSGVVEFPSSVGGEVVHLVWERGQREITHYHRLTGDDQPRPLEGGTGVPAPATQDRP